MLLSQGKKGKAYIVKELNMHKDALRRFEVLGMIPGTKISILNISASGAMIIKIRGTRFAIGKSFCQNTAVEEAYE